MYHTYTYIDTYIFFEYLVCARHIVMPFAYIYMYHTYTYIDTYICIHIHTYIYISTYINFLDILYSILNYILSYIHIVIYNIYI